MTWQNIKFGTDGWRAIIAEDFTFENVELVTAAIAKYLHDTYRLDQIVLISYDPRFLADKFAERAAQVLSSFGRKVLIVNRDTPTPVIAHAAKHLDTAGALQFTASHNPPEYCGLKYIPHFAGPAGSEITSRITKYVIELGQQNYKFIKPSEKPNFELFDPKPAYLKDLHQIIDLQAIEKAGLKIGVDSLCGAGRGYFNQLISCKVLLGQERDPLFRGALPEPVLHTLTDLIIQIKEQKLDLGLSNDGDADRFALLDNQGYLYSPNQILCILTKYLVEKRGLKGAIVRTVATTHLLDNLASKLGLQLIETPVGFKHIGEIMRQKEVLIGGEESGGLSILGHIPEKDGILACLLICEAVAKSQKSLAELWQEVLDFAGYEPANLRLDLHLSSGLKEKIIKDLKNQAPSKFAGYQVQAVNQQDGIKLLLEEGNWVLIRPSGTEPLLRVYLEAKDKSTLQKLKSAAEDKWSESALCSPVK